MKSIQQVHCSVGRAALGHRLGWTMRARRGLGIAELLVCLVISSMLLTAVAMAYPGQLQQLTATARSAVKCSTLGRGFMN